MAAIVAAEENGTRKEDVSPRDDGKYLAQALTMQLIVSMAIKAFTELGIPDILSNAKQPMTAEQIVSELANKSGTGSAHNLKRLLRPLVREGVVGESLNEQNTPVYSLTKISRCFTTSNEYSVVPLLGFFFSKQFVSSWPHLKECVLDDAALAFELANGAPLYDYIEKDPEFSMTLQRGMLGSNPEPEVRQLVGHLQQSGALDGVKTFMDLGGGHLGLVSGIVVAQNPHIHGINFDLPYVIVTAAPVKGNTPNQIFVEVLRNCQQFVHSDSDVAIVLQSTSANKFWILFGSGVEHVGGDYFKSIPSADAIFMKFILHNHGDEDSIKILKNCFTALPSKGKVILAEYVFTDSKKHSPVGTVTEYIDLVMMTMNKSGMERTKEEYQKLLEAAGFPHVSLLVNPEGVDLVVAVKD